jgi:hypothetical protein
MVFHQEAESLLDPLPRVAWKQQNGMFDREVDERDV